MLQWMNVIERWGRGQDATRRWEKSGKGPKGLQQVLAKGLASYRSPVCQGHRYQLHDWPLPLETLLDPKKEQVKSEHSTENISNPFSPAVNLNENSVMMIRSAMCERSWEMLQRLSEIGVGRYSTIWVAHSKGGLYVKQLLVHCKLTIN